MEYKDSMKRSHPYDGYAPEKDISEKVPVITGHDDQIELGSNQGAPLLHSTPFFISQTPPPSRLETHDHPGDDAYLKLPAEEGEGSSHSSHNPGPYLGGGLNPTS